ncbi:MAG: beta-galactosidase [Anaerolineae bacterium]|nr:beta-galactosidase [Anaerolineae bacterium]
MPAITFDSTTLRIDGAPALIQAGALHYFHLPHADLWPPALERMRMAGLNAVLVPFPWAYHSPAAGLYDFTGPRNIPALLDAVERAGLWLIAAAGPWTPGFDVGGVPSWCRHLGDFAPRCDSEVPPGPSFTFLRTVREWWERLFPCFVNRPNLLLLSLDPGACDAGDPLSRYVHPLISLARELGVHAPCVLPAELLPDGALAEERILAWTRLEMGEAPEGSLLEGTGQAPAIAEVALTPALPQRHGQAPATLLPPGHPRPALLATLAQSVTVYALAPAHRGVAWGYWNADPADAAAPLGEGSVFPDAYYYTRKLTQTAESLGSALTAARAEPMAYASEPRTLRAARTGETATLAFLDAALAEHAGVRVSLALGGELLTTGPVPLLDGAVRFLPLNWKLAGGVVLTTTLEPVLHTAVAGRHLLILSNTVGGDLLLSDDFRLRHARGPVRTQRTSGGLAVRFEPSRVASLLLDGPEGSLQLLALAPQLAARVWPLDDGWRTTPAYPATWRPAPEDPERGLVIGPEFVQPRAGAAVAGSGGVCAYLGRDKGAGYRWGPWRGSDPHTWLSPLAWPAPRPVKPPALVWEPPRQGADEVSPAYDDAGWRYIAQRAPLAMTEHGVETGFVWYRGRFKGQAGAVTLRCPHACDVFFNGAHIAALNPAPDAPPDVPKTLPLPARLLRDENVLAILVEGMTNTASWEALRAPRGLLSCELDSGLPLLWRIRGGLSGERLVQGFPGYAEVAWLPEFGSPQTLAASGDVFAITWHNAFFEWDLPDAVECSLYLFLEQIPAKAYIFLNGMLVGRYWDAYSVQSRFWLPEGILRRGGENELLIAQWTRGAKPGIGVARLETGPVMQWFVS